MCHKFNLVFDIIRRADEVGVSLFLTVRLSLITNLYRLKFSTPLVGQFYFS